MKAEEPELKKCCCVQALFWAGFYLVTGCVYLAAFSNSRRIDDKAWITGDLERLQNQCDQTDGKIYDNMFYVGPFKPKDQEEAQML